MYSPWILGQVYISYYTGIHSQSKFFKNVFRQQVLLWYKPSTGVFFWELPVKTLTTNGCDISLFMKGLINTRKSKIGFLKCTKMKNGEG